MPGTSALGKRTPGNRPEDSRYAQMATGRVPMARRPEPFGLNGIPIVGYGAVPHNIATNNAAGTGYTSRAAYRAVTACTDLRVVLPGWYIPSGTNPSTEVAAPNTLTHKVAIEYNGAFYPAAFGGGIRKVTMDQWGTLISDPVGLELAAGDQFAVRTFFDTPASGSYVSNTYCQGSVLYGIVAGYGFTNGDAVDATGNSTTTGNFALPTPITVLGTPLGTPPPVIIGVGDSITYGTGDTSPGSAGWLLRGLNDTRPFLNLANPGITAATWADKTKRTRYGPFISYGQHAVVMLGTNDFFVTGQALASTQTNVLKVWTQLAARGLAVHAATLVPQTTSTDAWATTTNQTVLAQESRRTGLNDWIRAGAPIDPSTKAAVAIGTAGALLFGSPGHPAVGYYETADTVETARNSGIWKVAAATTDGIHPGAAGHTLMAAAVNLSTLT